MNTLGHAAVAALLSLAAALPASAGRPDKYRVFVVTQGTLPIADSGRMAVAEEYFEAVAQARFNVIAIACSHKAPFDLDRVRREAAWAGKHGLLYAQWLRGKTDAGDGARYTYPDGVVQGDASPNSPALWKRLTETITGYAQVSAENPAMIGAFVDMENYHTAKAGAGDLYQLSYDDATLADFARAHALALPAPLPQDRKGWLDGKNLHAAFAEYQISLWRQRCRELRQAVDKINPRFQFFICPGEPRSPFQTEAICAEWATAQAPLVMAGEATYGRPTSVTPQRIAIELNQRAVSDAKTALSKKASFFAFVGGVDPVVRGADAEFCARNAAALSQSGDGYWVFFEGAALGSPEHANRMAWFARANKAIVEGDASFAGAARETPAPFTGAHVGLDLQPLPDAGAPAHAPGTAFTVREGQSLVVLLEAGEELRASVEAVEVRKDRPGIEAVVADSQGRELSFVRIEPGQTKPVSATAAAPGVYCLAVGAEKLAARVLVENRLACLLTGAEPLRLHGPQPDAFFAPAPGAKSVTVRLQVVWIGSSLPVHAVLFRPSGAEAAREPLVKGKTVQIGAAVTPDEAGKAWRLSLEGDLKGASIHLTLGDGTGGLMATDPSRLLTPAGPARKGQALGAKGVNRGQQP